MSSESNVAHGEGVSQQPLAWPPGHAADIAQFIYNAAERPVREVAIAGAIGLLAGICGRQWQVSKTGLNAYVILVARSAIGKEAMLDGISTLINAVAALEPRATSFVNFDDMASGQALIKAIAANPCFVNVAGEFGHKFAEMASRKPNPAMASLRRAMTNLYSKSGFQSIAGGIKYSNKDNDIQSLLAASYSMLGETTPRTFYEAITPSMMADGFMSRFIIIQYDGDRPESNAMRVHEPWPGMVTGIAELVRHAFELFSRNICQTVIAVDGAQLLLDRFKIECDAQIRRAGDDEAQRQMYNRAHLKALRTAALLAVVDNCFVPSITTAHATWAIDLVRRDIATFSARLDSGDVGDDDAARKNKVISILIRYVENPPEKYKALREAGLAPDQYLQTRTQNLAAFNKHPLGANKALKQTVDALIEGGVLQKAQPDKVAEKVPKAKGVCYYLMNLPGYEQVWRSVHAEQMAEWDARLKAAAAVADAEYAARQR